MLGREGGRNNQIEVNLYKEKDMIKGEMERWRNLPKVLQLQWGLNTKLVHNPFMYTRRPNRA